MSLMSPSITDSHGYLIQYASLGSQRMNVLREADAPHDTRALLPTLGHGLCGVQLLNHRTLMAQFLPLNRSLLCALKSASAEVTSQLPGPRKSPPSGPLLRNILRASERFFPARAPFLARFYREGFGVRSKSRPLGVGGIPGATSPRDLM